jgi:aminopeptidase N
MTAGLCRLCAAVLWLSVAHATAGRAEPHADSCGGDPGGAGPQPCVTVVHYDARLTVDIAAGRIAGTVVLTARGHGAAADALQLDSGDLVVDAVTVHGRGVEFSAAGQRTLVRLPHRLQAGEQVPVSVTYHGEPHGGIRFLSGQEQVYTAFSTSQWMVCVDAPDQKATLRLSVAVPPGLVSVGSGRAVRDHEWVLDTPVSTYLFGFAAGRFHTVTDVRHGVRLQYVADSYSDQELRAIFRETPDMLTFFEERSGVRYRGGVYTQVLAGGSVQQEAGLLTLLSASYGRTLLDDPSDVWLEAHEFAHQWWGNGVTCRDWTHFWLNEGIATFMADAYKERRFGRASYLKEIEASRERYERVREAGHDKALVFADWTHPTAADRTIVYHKGAYVLHLLRTQLGEERFWAGLRAFTRTFMGQSVTTPDFQRAMERASGTDLTDFFRRWVYTADGAV